LPLQFAGNCTITVTSFFGPMSSPGMLYFDYVNNYQRIDSNTNWGSMIEIGRYDLGKDFKIAGGQCQEEDLGNQILYPMSLPPFAVYLNDENVDSIYCQKWKVDLFGFATVTYWITNTTYAGKNLWEPVRVLIDASNSGVDMTIQYDFANIVPGQPDPALFDYRQFGCAPAPPPPTFKLAGYVRDATNNKVIPNAAVSLSGGQSTTTGADGSYTFTGLTAGVYTVIAAANNYFKTQISVNLTKDVNFGTFGDLVLAPVAPAGTYRVVLTWGSYPADLDSYIVTPSNCQVSYSNRRCPTANLDVDARSGFGPETITLTPSGAGSYTYRVQTYSAGILAGSNAQVSVYGGSGLLTKFAVSTLNSGNARNWKVFSIDQSGNVTPINTFY